MYILAPEEDSLNENDGLVIFPWLISDKSSGSAPYFETEAKANPSKPSASPLFFIAEVYIVTEPKD
jgi:hypothetical protein